MKRWNFNDYKYLATSQQDSYKRFINKNIYINIYIIKTIYIYKGVVADVKKLDKLIEKEVEAILVKEMKLIGGRAYKWVSPGNSGVPDRIVMFPEGSIEFVEMKTEDGRPTENQRVQMRRLRSYGHDVSVVYGVKGLCGFFEYNGHYSIAEKLRRKYGKADWFEKGKYVFNGEKIV